MKLHRASMPALAAVLICVTSTSLAQQVPQPGAQPAPPAQPQQQPQQQPPSPPPGTQHMPMGQRTPMGQDMPTSQDMMRMCRQMMMSRSMAGQAGGPMAGPGHVMLPRLPPGNEALQMQMDAEMMRQMADVLEKYSGRIRQAQAPGTQQPMQQ